MTPSQQISDFCKSMGESNAYAAVKKKATQVRTLVAGPPFVYNCDSVKQQLNIEDIRESRTLTLDGRTFRGKHGYVVEINTLKPKARQRFTLAHEIAHTFFMPFDPPDLTAGRTRHDDEMEERLCDATATELLMPEKEAGQLLLKIGPSAGSVLRVAAVFDVSLVAAGKRLANLISCNCYVGFWRIEGDGAVFENGFASRYCDTYVATDKADTVALIEKTARSTKPVVFNDADLGFVSRRKGHIANVMTEAIILPSAKRILSCSVFEKHPQFHLQRFRIAAEYERIEEWTRTFLAQDFEPQRTLFENNDELSRSTT